MERVINASSDKKINSLVVDDVPDISNRLIEADVLFAWLDKLVEVKENAESNRGYPSFSCQSLNYLL